MWKHPDHSYRTPVPEKAVRFIDRDGTMWIHIGALAYWIVDIMLDAPCRSGSVSTLSEIYEQPAKKWSGIPKVQCFFIDESTKNVYVPYSAAERRINLSLDSYWEHIIPLGTYCDNTGNPIINVTVGGNLYLKY